jgi:hypothetical protein
MPVEDKVRKIEHTAERVEFPRNNRGEFPAEAEQYPLPNGKRQAKRNGKYHFVRRPAYLPNAVFVAVGFEGHAGQPRHCAALRE